MGPIGNALLVVLIILIIVGSYWVAKHACNLRFALNNWGERVDPGCDDPTKSPAACAPMLSGPLTPPPVEGRPTVGPPSFDAPTATYAAKLTARFIAYLSTGNTSLITMTDMMAPILSFPSSGQKIALAATWASLDGYTAVVAVRGTKTVGDFRLDMQYGQVLPRIRQITLTRPAVSHLGSAQIIHVHSGMYSAYVDIRDSLFAALPTALTSRGTGTIFIAGHSMGAAVANYYALELAVAYPHISVTVVGLAPPRAGDAAFAADLSAAANCMSIINLADFVPSLPWSYMPNMVPQYSADQYAHVTPIFAFSNRKADITACHGTLAYFEGITGAVPPAYVPSM